MTTVTNLDLSNVINVTLLGTPQGLQVNNVNTIGLFTTDAPAASFVLGYKIYTDPNSVATDFGTTSETYLQAVAIFSQNPNLLGTNGYLVVLPLLTGQAVKASKSVQDIIYTAVNAGTAGNSITIEYVAGGVKGAEVVTVVSSAISVSMATGSSTTTGIATAIAASAAASALVTATVANGKANTTQVAAVSVNLANGAASGGVETILDAIVRTQPLVYYFGILAGQAIADNLSVLGSSVQANDKLLFLSSTTAGDIIAGGTFDLIRQASLSHTRCIYNSTSAQVARIMAAAYAGRALSTDFSGSLTSGTMHLKSLVGQVADPGLSQTALINAQITGTDVYPSIAGLACVFCSGTNVFFDEIYNEIWLKFALQVAGFNYIRQTNTKVPQTEVGITGLKGAYSQVLAQAVNNGYIAAGAWTSATTFGNPTDLIRNIADVGYYIYSLPVSSQTTADRTARKAPLIQIAIKTAGAVHSSNVIVNVNL